MSPLPLERMDSINRISPPTEVHAKPVTTPAPVIIPKIENPSGPSTSPIFERIEVSVPRIKEKMKKTEKETDLIPAN